MPEPSVWQLVRRAAARRLKRWADDILDDILREGDASLAPPAGTGTTPGTPTPAGADVRAARGGPPANWLADIQRRAPHLIVDGQFLATEQGGAPARRWPEPLGAMTADAALSPSVARAPAAPRSAPEATRAPTQPVRRARAPGAPPPAAPRAEGAAAPPSAPAPPRAGPAHAHAPRRLLDGGGAESRRDDEDGPAMTPARRAEPAPIPPPEPPRTSPYRSKPRHPGEVGLPGVGRDANHAPDAAPETASATVWERPLRREGSASSTTADARRAPAVPSERVSRRAVAAPLPRPPRWNAAPTPVRAEQAVDPEPARKIPDWFAAWVAARQQSAPLTDPRSGSRRHGAPASPSSDRPPTVASASASSHFPRTAAPREQASARPAPPPDQVGADPWPTLPPTPSLDPPDADDLALDLAARERRRRLRREQAGLLT